MWAIVAQANGVSCVYGPFESWEAAWDWARKTFAGGPVNFQITSMHAPNTRM